LTYVLFVLGFPLLIVAANLLINGATALARRLNISEFAIGLSVIALGTTAPEMVVNIYASAEGVSGIVIGNILGSCIFNILVILGLSAAIRPLKVGKTSALKEVPFVLLATLIVGIVANDALTDGGVTSVISRGDGLLMLIFLVLIMGSILRTSRDSVIEEQVPEVGKVNMPRVIITILAGFVGLYFGARWIVDGAVTIARLAGVSELTIGLTIVAVGTGLPELTTAVVAAYRRKAAIAVGNIVGANILNLLLILSMSAIIRPFNFDAHSNIDLLVTLAASALLMGSVFVGRNRYEIGRWQGVVFVMLYLLYIIYLAVSAAT
jgi:cation:H+ antiporter